jgi:uncharacterized protein with PIN domain
MIENRTPDDPFTYDRRRRCPHCAALSRLTHSLLDSQDGNTVRVYQCIGCGKRIWDESPRLRARLH